MHFIFNFKRIFLTNLPKGSEMLISGTEITSKGL